MLYICLIPLAPMRAEASHRSEMTTQLCFGEVCELLESSDEWLLLRSTLDQYEGYVDKTQMHAIQADKQNRDLLSFTHINTQAELIKTAQEQMLIPAGSLLSTALIKHCNVENMPASARPFEPTLQPETLCYWAKSFLNAPYLWGGKNQMGFDCSGFVQILYRIGGYKLPRDASQQAKVGQNINFLSETQAGDLAFFDNEEKLITHVGMLLSPSYIIHASGKVRIDRIDHHGIFKTETQNYSHKLRVIKRMIKPKNTLEK